MLLSSIFEFKKKSLKFYISSQEALLYSKTKETFHYIPAVLAITLIQILQYQRSGVFKDAIRLFAKKLTVSSEELVILDELKATKLLRKI